MRKQFSLPDNDEGFLEALGRPWETVVDGAGRWLLVQEFAVPAGYGHVAVHLAVSIAPGYPDVQLDMVYFHPHLVRTDGKPLGAVSAGFPIDGRDWQRWSRHRTGANPWRPGLDDLSTHVVLVEEWLRREFR